MPWGPADAVIRALNFNEKAGGGASRPGQEAAYKVLVLDATARDLLAPLLRVSDLRKHGVTLHLMLDSERQNISDVPAIYLCEASSANIKRIAQDAQLGVYEALYVNFIGELETAGMDALAGALVEADCVNRVARVHDQMPRYLALEERFFTLNMPRAYVSLNHPRSDDGTIQAAVDTVVSGLLSVLSTAGVVPIIRCPRGGAAQAVAQALDAKLREQLTQRGNAFEREGGAQGFQRPLLVLFDRNFDLVAQVQHAWSYHALVHDCLGLKLNRIMLPDADSSQKGKSYDVGSDDFFWEENGNSQFPKVAEEVEIQLERYKQALEAVNRSASGQADVEEADALQANTKTLMDAVSSLPELAERKKIIDKHTNIGTALLGSIKARQIDHLCSLEEELLMGKAEKGALLRDLSLGRGTSEDRLRMALVWLLTSESVPPPSDMEEVERALRTGGSEVEALQYARRLRQMGLTGAARSTPGGGLQAASSHSSSQGNFLDIADKLYSQGISAVTKGMANLMGVGAQNAITKAVESLMEGKGGQESETFLFLDPRLARGTSPGERARAAAREAVVFVIGGGTYLEYHSLQEWGGQAQPRRQIAYGATEALTSEEFLHQLTEIGKAQ